MTPEELDALEAAQELAYSITTHERHRHQDDFERLVLRHADALIASARREKKLEAALQTVAEGAEPQRCNLDGCDCAAVFAREALGPEKNGDEQHGTDNA